MTARAPFLALPSFRLTRPPYVTLYMDLGGGPGAVIYPNGMDEPLQFQVFRSEDARIQAAAWTEAARLLENQEAARADTGPDADLAVTMLRGTR